MLRPAFLHFMGVALNLFRWVRGLFTIDVGAGTRACPYTSIHESPMTGLQHCPLMLVRIFKTGPLVRPPYETGRRFHNHKNRCHTPGGKNHLDVDKGVTGSYIVTNSHDVNQRTGGRHGH